MIELRWYFNAMKKYFFIFLLLIPSALNAQGPGIATNPNPPDSSKNIFWFFQNLNWTNPPSATNLKVYLGIHPYFLTELYNGAVINNFQIPSPLEIRKTYYWRVDEIDSSGITEGQIWLFTTKSSVSPVFIDSFNNGLSNWTVQNITDTCGWKWKDLSLSSYSLPPTADKFGVSLENKLCSNSRIEGIISLSNVPSLINFTRLGIGWDNDLSLNNFSDTAYVEVSKDGGINWERVWERQGRSQRKSQEIIALGFRSSWDLKIRFKGSFQGKYSWWAIDNFFIFGSSLAYFPEIPPNNLTYNLNIGDSLNVLLQWQPGVGPPSVDRYRIQKKLGDSLSQFAFFTIGETDLNTFSFLDTKVGENVEYTYRVGICEGPLHGWNSLPLTLLVLPLPVELTRFYATTENNNVTLHWETSTETNNKGFEIFRFAEKPSDGWKKVGFIEGAGTTTEPHSYTFIDKNLLKGKYRYVLKQIDLNGQDWISQEIIVLVLTDENSVELFTNFPNPFNDLTIIEFVSGKHDDIELQVYNTLGECVQKLFNGPVEIGKHYKITFNAFQLSSGIYFYSLTQGERRKLNKMILLK